MAVRKPPFEPCRNPVQLLQLSVTMMSGPLRLAWLHVAFWLSIRQHQKPQETVGRVVQPLQWVRSKRRVCGHQQSTAHSTKNTRSDEYSPWRKDPFLSTHKVHWSRKLRGEHGRAPRKEERGWEPSERHVPWRAVRRVACLRCQ